MPGAQNLRVKLANPICEIVLNLTVLGLTRVEISPKSFSRKIIFLKNSTHNFARTRLW